MAKRPTKKQLAARRKFVAAVRAGKFRKGKRKANPRTKSKPDEIVKGEIVDRNTEAEIKTTKGTWVYRKWIKQFGRKPLFPWEAVMVEGGQKVEKAKTKAALLKKLGQPLERAKKNPAKKRIAKRKKTARKNPAKRKTFGKRNRVIRATYRTKNGYRSYYLKGAHWIAKKADATRFGEKNGRARMRAIVNRLEPGISKIVLVKA